MNAFLKNKTALIWLVLGLTQVAIPASMIVKMERIHQVGESFRFRLAPYDPADPFRGRYMALRFDLETTPVPAPADFEEDKVCYGVLQRDADGTASISRVVMQEPKGSAYLRLKPDETQLQEGMPRKVLVRVGLDRFYMNETRASEVESYANERLQAARKANTPSDIFAEVRILEGEAVVTELRGPKGKL